MMIPISIFILSILNLPKRDARSRKEKTPISASLCQSPPVSAIPSFGWIIIINDNIEVAIKDFITKVNHITKGEH